MTRTGPDIFVLAGESSGDQIGADLMARLREKGVTGFSGVGGAMMKAEGLNSMFPMEDLAVMGVVDVLRSLPKILFRLRQVGNHILRTRPDAVVLIDNQVFCRMLAQRLRKAGYDRPIILYVAPSVWAYGPERAKRLAPLFDEVLAILPFEPQVMANLGGPATQFVGHPALSQVRHGAPGVERTHFAMLPGSRRGELRRHMPMFGEVAARLHRSNPDMHFYLPTLPHIAAEVSEMTEKWDFPVELVVDRPGRQALGEVTKLALVASGTATLETAMSGIPMVVTYVMDAAQRRAYHRLTVEHISLPNIILGEPLVPELLFERPDANRLEAALKDLLDDEDSRLAQLRGFEEMEAYMKTGTPEHPRCDPAERVLAHLKAR